MRTVAAVRARRWRRRSLRRSLIWPRPPMALRRRSRSVSAISSSCLRATRTWHSFSCWRVRTQASFKLHCWRFSTSRTALSFSKNCRSWPLPSRCWPSLSNRHQTCKRCGLFFSFPIAQSFYPVLTHVLLFLLLQRRVLAAEVLERLLEHDGTRQDVIRCGGMRSLLRLLSSKVEQLTLMSLRCLSRLCAADALHAPSAAAATHSRDRRHLPKHQHPQNNTSCSDLRLLGGIPLVLSLINRDNGNVTMAVATAVCTLLAHLCFDDECSAEIRKKNCVYLLGDLVVQAMPPLPTPPPPPSAAPAAPDTLGAATEASVNSSAAPLFPPSTRAVSHNVAATAASTADADLTTPGRQLQLFAFRALRMLFCLERNRKVFKRLFSAELFAAFIDIGNYVLSVDAYRQLVGLFNAV